MDKVFAFFIIVVLAIIIFVKLNSSNPVQTPSLRAPATPAPATQAAAAPRATTPAALEAASRGTPPAARPAQPPVQTRPGSAPQAPPQTSCIDDIRRVCKKHNVTIIRLTTPQPDRVDLTIKGSSRQDLSYILDDLLNDLHILKDINNEDMRYWQAMEKGGSMAYFATYKMRVSK